MGLHDVSLDLTADLPIYPGNPAYTRALASSIAHGAPANVSLISMGAHTGTHVDAPVHFFDDRGGVETLPLETLIGSCLVVEVGPGADGELGASALPADHPERVLFKTQNSRHWSAANEVFDPGFVAVGTALAERIVEAGVKLVGVDYLSVAAFHAPASHPVHHLLLGHGVVVVEGLDLSRVDPGLYELICLPIRAAGSDGGPARVVLRSGEEQ
ncbi:MAG: cyclase family protein [Actinobacteria bacterium]|nr:cyclase family protein [Actinomycetota bacterium]